MTSKYYNALKILALILTSTFLLLQKNTISIFLINSLLITLALVLSGQKIYSRLKPLFFISLLIILFRLVLGIEGTVEERLAGGIVASFRIISLSLLVFLYTAVTDPSNIIEGLFFLPKTFRLGLTMTLSLLTVIFDEINLINIIQQSRGYKKSFITPWKNIKPVIIPLLHRTFKRAEQLSVTLYSKGYSD